MKSVGNLHTWNNKQQGNDRVFSKLDKLMDMMLAKIFILILKCALWLQVNLIIHPGLITVYPRFVVGKKPFRYFTM